MNSSLEKIRSMSIEEQRALTYQELVEIITPLTADEIIKLSNIIGYPVFTRLLMGELKHRFVLLQDGAAAVILNDKKQILLQSRADRDKWGLPGGCQGLGERFVDTVIREIKEETNLDVNVSDLKLINSCLRLLVTSLRLFVSSFNCSNILKIFSNVTSCMNYPPLISLSNF